MMASQIGRTAGLMFLLASCGLALACGDDGGVAGTGPQSQGERSGAGEYAEPEAEKTIPNDPATLQHPDALQQQGLGTPA